MDDPKNVVKYCNISKTSYWMYIQDEIIILYCYCNDIMNCGQFVKVSGKIYDVLVIVVITAVCGPGKYYLSSKEHKKSLRIFYSRYRPGYCICTYNTILYTTYIIHTDYIILTQNKSFVLRMYHNYCHSIKIIYIVLLWIVYCVHLILYLRRIMQWYR